MIIQTKLSLNFNILSNLKFISFTPSDNSLADIDNNVEIYLSCIIFKYFFFVILTL